jgi:hypothetical protein
LPFQNQPAALASSLTSEFRCPIIRARYQSVRRHFPQGHRGKAVRRSYSTWLALFHRRSRAWSLATRIMLTGQGSRGRLGHKFGIYGLSSFRGDRLRVASSAEGSGDVMTGGIGSTRSLSSTEQVWCFCPARCPHGPLPDDAPKIRCARCKESSQEEIVPARFASIRATAER